VTQACCKPVLQSSTEQWERFFALTSAAVHVVASLQLYEEQVSIGVDAVAKAYCDPVLQRSTEQQGSCFVLTSAAVHVVASLQLYEEQVSIGVDAVAKAYCDPVLQRSTEQQGSCFVLTIAALLWCCITANLSEEQISICGTAVTQLLL